MNVVYAFLGAVAALQNGMRRFRINFIPSHWSATFLIGIFTIASFARVSPGHGDDIWTALWTLALVAWLLPMFMRQVVFRGDGVDELRRPGSAAALSGEGLPMPVRISGELALEDRASRRFVGVRGRLGLSDGGDPLLHADLDASPRGILALWGRNLRGTWHASLAHATLEHVEPGTQYLGLRGGFRAVRVRFANRTMILGFDDEASCARAVGLLTAKATRPKYAATG